MAKSIGIFVTSPQNMRHVVGITQAAVANCLIVYLFIHDDLGLARVNFL